MKNTVLFNKNHIQIIKYTNCNNESLLYKYTKYNNYVLKSELNYSHNPYAANSKDKYIEVVERKKSPLGFYYTCKTKKLKDNLLPETNYTIKKFEFVVNQNTKYVITYYSLYNNQIINVDLRPWDLIDKTSMPDHHVNAILKILNEIFIDADTNKCSYFTWRSSYDGCKYDKYDKEKFKNEIYTDMFGDPRGPRYQTNEEKILSHGFDLKVSFRKRPKK